jgi:hypothetical protein
VPPAAWQGPGYRRRFRLKPIQKTASHTEFLTLPIADEHAYDASGSPALHALDVVNEVDMPLALGDSCPCEVRQVVQ